MSGIVHKLESWLRENSHALRQKGIIVEERVPSPGANVPLKANVGLVHDGIVVSYTVWDRDKLQTELIVLNATTGQTIVMEDRIVDDIEVVNTDLRDITSKLINHTYLTMKPDPKLVIT
jgi:hypothetical protein